MGLYKRRDSGFYWIKIVIDGHIVQESTKTMDRQQAREYLDWRRAELWRERKLGEKPKRLWREAAERWLMEKSQKRDLANDKLKLAILEPHLGSLELSKVTREEVDKALAGRVLGQAGINRYRALVRSILRRSERSWGWIEHSPSMVLDREVGYEPLWLTREEASRLIDKAPEHLKPVIRLALATGLRKRNLFDLTWTQINWQRRCLTIPGCLMKGGKPLMIPLNRDALKVLEDLRGGHPEWVFSYRGRPLQPPTTRTWQAICKAADLEGLRFHDLRHTWASWLAQTGVDPQKIMELGGWKGLTMVLRYSHQNIDHLRDAAEKATF